MISREMATRRAVMSAPKRLRKYLEAGDGCCNCEEHSIEGGPFEQDGMFVSQEVWCTACGAKWTSIFKLVSIRDFNIEEAENEASENGR
jgi:hypothetical protein